MKWQNGEQSFLLIFKPKTKTQHLCRTPLKLLRLLFRKSTCLLPVHNRNFRWMWSCWFLVYNQSMGWTGRSFIQEMKLYSEKQSLVLSWVVTPGRLLFWKPRLGEGSPLKRFRCVWSHDLTPVFVSLQWLNVSLLWGPRNARWWTCWVLVSDWLILPVLWLAECFIM